MYAEYRVCVPGVMEFVITLNLSIIFCRGQGSAALEIGQNIQGMAKI
jgi:hypothetical protein